MWRICRRHGFWGVFGSSTGHGHAAQYRRPAIVVQSAVRAKMEERTGSLLWLSKSCRRGLLYWWRLWILAPVDLHPSLSLSHSRSLSQFHSPTPSSSVPPVRPVGRGS